MIPAGTPRARPGLRPANPLLVLILAGAVLLGLSLVHAGISAARQPEAPGPALVRYLALSDLAVFTEARYARHPATTDRFVAFQNHPMTLEHFPSGALLRPPGHLYE
ncbi:MAG TPA: hypothetical protein VK855_05450 [Thioalkalivibrio sp.]|nr:hypothetical protein [Thioalkalivibrio sp.]